MNAEEIVAVSATVVALVQLLKWSGVDDVHGPKMVLGVSAVGVGVWAVTFLPAFDRSVVFSLVAGWIAVATSAAGVYGFTRARGDILTMSNRPPAGGAGSEVTTKTPEGP